jgi:hypothetical protein
MNVAAHFCFPATGRKIHWAMSDRLRGVEIMASLQEFQCEICGIVTSKPVHWFVIQCNNAQLTVLKWETEAATAKGARHYCGEAHAQVYISRWLEAACTPPRPNTVSHATGRD